MTTVGVGGRVIAREALRGATHDVRILTLVQEPPTKEHDVHLDC